MSTSRGIRTRKGLLLCYISKFQQQITLVLDVEDCSVSTSFSSWENLTIGKYFFDELSTAMFYSFQKEDNYWRSYSHYRELQKGWEKLYTHFNAQDLS